jgi:muramoyltetrapeptide carboxypeptidase
LAEGRALLATWGLRVSTGTHVLDRCSGVGNLAGRDADRAADLERAWLDPDIAAVVCARGGYGAMRVLEHLDWAAMGRAAPKIFLGSSDITALHQAVAAHLGVATLFGPMLATATPGEPDSGSLSGLRTTLFHPEQAQVLTSPEIRVLVPGRARGIITGGTLTLLAATAGTSTAGRGATGGIAFLEDLNEAPYRIDRMLTQLLHAGWFTGVAGVVAGRWLRCGTPAEVDQVLLERLGPLGVPVLAGLDFGHGARQMTIPLGIPAELDTGTGTITLTTPALH